MPETLGIIIGSVAIVLSLAAVVFALVRPDLIFKKKDK